MNKQDSDLSVKPELPNYKMIYNEIPEKNLEKVIFIAEQAIEKHRSEKDAADFIVEELKKIEEIDFLGQGEWQCFVGKYLAASLSFDTSVLSFFTLTQQKRTVLVFKS